MSLREENISSDYISKVIYLGNMKVPGFVAQPVEVIGNQKVAAENNTNGYVINVLS